MKDIKNKLKKQLEGPTNIVLENIELTGELTNFLFSETNIKKIYLIKYNSSSIGQLNQIINNKEICSIENLTTSDLSNEEIIFCLDKSNYFNPNYSLIANHKSIKALCFLGFPESSFSVTPKSETCIVTNKSISELITSNNTANTLQTQTDTSKTRICHNRNSEKDALVNFLANNDKRLLIIHGFPGLGKSNLLDELKRKAPNREYIPFTFESQSDTYKDIVHEISPYFSLNISSDELRQIQISDRTQRDLINGFFNSFNVRENSTLIFESVHKILNYDNEAGRFISP